MMGVPELVVGDPCPGVDHWKIPSAPQVLQDAIEVGAKLLVVMPAEVRGFRHKDDGERQQDVFRNCGE